MRMTFSTFQPRSQASGYAVRSAPHGTEPLKLIDRTGVRLPHAAARRVSLLGAHSRGTWSAA